MASYITIADWQNTEAGYVVDVMWSKNLRDYQFYIERYTTDNPQFNLLI